MSKGTLDDIKPDSFIGTAAVPQPDGSLKALEVHVFAASLRGTGEGHSAWESADGKVSVSRHQDNRKLRFQRFDFIHPIQTVLSIFKAFSKIHIEKNRVNLLFR